MDLPITTKRAFGILLFGLLVGLVFSLLGIVILFSFIAFTQGIDSLPPPWIKSILFLGELFLVSPPLLYLWIKGYNLKSTLRVNRISVSVVILSLIIGISSSVLSSEIDSYLIPFFPKDGIFKNFHELLTQIPEMMRITTLWEGVLLFLGGVGVAATLEEFLFRGFLQQVLEKNLGVFSAIFFTSFLFSLIHGNLLWGIQIFLIGILLGWVAWRTNSIWPGVIIHGINNSLAILFMNRPHPDANGHPGDHFSFLMVVSAIGFFIAGIYCVRKWTLPAVDSILPMR